MNNMNCGNCLWWQRHTFNGPGQPRPTERAPCKRRAPSAKGGFPDRSHPAWPDTCAGDYCGDWAEFEVKP